MFESLSQKLETVFKKLRGEGRITEANVSENLREVRRVLLDADVNYKVAKQFIEDVQKRALGQDVLNSITPGQLIIKIIFDEMVKLLGESKAEIRSSQTPPTVVLIAGLQGSGKTTFAAKLAGYLKSKGSNPLLVAADIHRPAAIDQLISLGKQLDIPVFTDRGQSAVKIAGDSIDFARKNIRDTVIIDTAGRLHIDEEMMQEVASIKETTKPHEILFVVDAMTGQDAVNTAKAFHDRLNFDGVVLTKLDGDSRGGAALSIRSVVQRPIKFIGTGEKLDQEKAVKLEEKLRKSQLTLEDFLEQLREIKKMGPLSQVIGMLPGMNRMPADVQVDDNALVRIEAVIQSMTPDERNRPSIINGSRRRRIAMGSGTTVQEVNRLLKQFEEMQRMMKRFSKGGMKRAMQGMRLPTR
jgi:signal recognition particle subunit SRP54